VETALFFMALLLIAALIARIPGDDDEDRN
jgi:hypothetical protein